MIELVLDIYLSTYGDLALASLNYFFWCVCSYMCIVCEWHPCVCASWDSIEPIWRGVNYMYSQCNSRFGYNGFVIASWSTILLPIILVCGLTFWILILCVGHIIWLSMACMSSLAW